MAGAVSLPPWPIFEPDELAAVEAVLRSGRVNYWTGTACRDFEAAWSRAHGGVHCVSMANGSLTMDAALHALGIGAGDEVVVSPRSYVASAMCVALTGATPVLADVDPESGCITAASAEAVRSARTRAVIPVHIGGWPCDMPSICAWADRHGICVVEDCAQAHGATIGAQPVGTFGQLASWSFCQDKIMTTGGEGGMLSTRDEALAKQCWSYAQHGKDFDEAMAGSSPDDNGHFRWLVRHVGTNLRMTEMQAAIGLVQLAKLPRWVAARRRNSLIMQDALRTVPLLRVPETPPGHAHYRCVAFVEGEAAPAARDQLLRALRERGLPGVYGSCAEISRESLFVDRGFTPGALRRGPIDGDGRLPVARRLGETSLTFLCHHTVDEAAMRAYADAVVACLNRSRRSVAAAS